VFIYKRFHVYQTAMTAGLYADAWTANETNNNSAAISQRKVSSSSVNGDIAFLWEWSQFNPHKIQTP